MVYWYCLVMLEGINGDLCRNGEKDDDEIASDKTAGNETAATNRPIPTSKLVTSSENVLHHGCLGIGYVKQEMLRFLPVILFSSFLVLLCFQSTTARSAGVITTCSRSHFLPLDKNLM